MKLNRVLKISIFAFCFLMLFNLALPAVQADIFDEITLNLLVFETEDVYAMASREMPLQVTIARILSYALGFLGILFVALIIYGGFTWMLSGGNEEQVKKAQGIIKNGVYGLTIVLGAYAITWFVLRALIKGFG